MTDDDRLADLLLVWEERYERGDDVPAAELCADRFDLVPILQARIDDLKRIGWLDNDPRSERVDPVATPSPPGEPLAKRYRLDALIGTGGFGHVWRGYDVVLERPVAVKIPRADRSWGSAAAVDSVLAEARRAARLKHPGIVQVYDVGRQDDTCFIVSELIDGVDLGRAVTASPLGAREALRIAIEVADALDHAHQSGIAHRDVKPGNILIDQAGRAFLTDFGIAVSPTDCPTDGGAGRGTPAYMAPEQLTGSGGVDARADIYSLGVVLQELLTGRRPGCPLGVDDTAQGTLTTRRLVPRSVAPLLDRCLASRPADRFLSAGEFASRLRHVESKLLTEPEWHACGDPSRMLTHVSETQKDMRKVRLFACGCARLDWATLMDQSREGVEASERYADALVTRDDLRDARTADRDSELVNDVWELTVAYLRPAREAAWSVVRGEPSAAARAAWTLDSNGWTAAINASRHLPPRDTCDIWRDLFGPDLFRPPPRRRWLLRAEAAVAIADRMNRTGVYDQMSDLGDALEAAGCDEPSVLAHCRGGGRHFRGCWVVDLVLGKA